MIKHIIFDFGGVLLDLDYQRTFDQLGELMGLQLSLDTMPNDLKDVYLQFERGEMKSETFMWHIQKLSRLQISEPHKIIRAWNAMLLGWNPDRLPWLLTLKEKFHTYLLSNTNAIHIDWVRHDLKKTHKIEDFESRYFDCVHYSHEVGMQKPSAAIFTNLLISNSIDPRTALFVDDNSDNVSAAQRQGLHAVQHDPTTEIMEMLPTYIARASERDSISY